MIKIIHDSDLHYENGKPRESKKRNVEKIQEQNPDILIATGDLTDNGYDGKSFLCIKYGGDDNQVKTFREKYYDPLNRSSALKIYLCPGNHDRGEKILGFRYKPMFNFIKKKNGSIRYSVNDFGIRFVCCGIYPKKKHSKWLRKQLNCDGPNIIFFHYNLKGPWSDWWSDKAKRKFYETVRDFPILAVLEGHNHTTKKYNWKPYGMEGDRIPVLRSSGSGCRLINYSTETKSIESTTIL